MKIQSIQNSGTWLPPELVRPELGLSRDRKFSLIVGKEYVVHGITTFLGSQWFYICDEDFSYYPSWHPMFLFKVTDSRLSSYWRIGFHKRNDVEAPSLIIAFREWVEEPFFYDRLTDGDTSAIETFNRYKDLLDAEARK